MKKITINDLNFSGVKTLSRERQIDNRGSFSRIFCGNELANAGWHKPIAQLNHSFNVNKGTVRGLHFQYPPSTEMKLITCLKGEIFDVVVDIRRESANFLKWKAQILSEENNLSLLIPEGFAHGFQTLTKNTEILYCHSNFYNQESQSGLNINDPIFNIKWPASISTISKRDENFAFIDSNFEGISI